MWYVCTTTGYCALAATYTVNLQCVDAPIATNDEACVACGESVTIDVIANDLPFGAPIQPTSVTIVTAPTKGTIINPLDGTIIYTPLAGQTGTDTFTYTVSNLASQVSNEATVTIDITCAGEDAFISVCN